MKNLNKRITSVVLTMIMVSVLGGEALAMENDDNANPKVGIESIDRVVDSLVEDNNMASKYEEIIEEDIETLDSLGLPVEKIDNVNTKRDTVVYEMPVGNGIKDELTVDTEKDGTIVMTVKEDNKKDELILCTDGTIYLDGQKVVYEIEEINSFEGEDNLKDNSMLIPSTGGIKWYTSGKAPSKLKKASYGGYRESWRCSNLKLQKALGNIAYGTLVGLMTGISGAALGFTTTAYWELVNIDKSTKNISYIEYIAKAKKNARYYKRRIYTYAKTKFKGKKTTSYSYGIML